AGGQKRTVPGPGPARRHAVQRRWPVAAGCPWLVLADARQGRRRAGRDPGWRGLFERLRARHRERAHPGLRVSRELAQGTARLERIPIEWIGMRSASLASAHVLFGKPV